MSDRKFLIWLLVSLLSILAGAFILTSAIISL